MHDLHKRADGYGHFAHTETHARGHSGAIVPAATAQGLQRKRFNRRHGPDIFHQKGLALAFSGVEILQALTEGPHGQKDDQSRKAGKKQHQHGQPPAVRKQDGQHHKERDAVQHGAEQTARKKFTNFFRLLHMFDEHAGRGALKKGQGHAGEMLKSADGQAQVNNAGGVEQQVGAQPAEDSLKNDGRQHAQGQHMEGDFRVVGHHPVNNNLKKQGHGQAQHLQCNGGQAHFGHISLHLLYFIKKK